MARINLECSHSDRKIFKRELDEFLPEHIFDSHVHLFDEKCYLSGSVLPPKNCYQRFGGYFTLEDYLHWAVQWLPGRQLMLNSFGSPSPDRIDRGLSAEYTASCSDNRRYFGMVLVSPEDPVELVAQRIRENHLIGFKPYLNFVNWKPADDVTIEDMLTAEQLELADELQMIITFHIPRKARLADQLNQSQMVALCRRYPRVAFIFAHIGRAYFMENVRGNLDALAACPNAWLDTAMVNHAGVLDYALRHFPRERILFGSDAPIALLRGKSIEVNNQYAYLMGEDFAIGTTIYDAAGALSYTTFFFEQLRGIKSAAERASLSATEVERLLFSNSYNLFKTRATQLYG